MQIRTSIWILISVLTLAISAGAQQDAGSKQPSQPAAPAVATEVSKPAATTDGNYIIGAQGGLDISVWKESEGSRVVPVRPDGKISLPLLNDVQAAGLTPAQLAAQLTDGLMKFVTNPQVTVIVT